MWDVPRAFQFREATFNTQLLRCFMNHRTPIHFRNRDATQHNHSRAKRHRFIIGSVHGDDGSIAFTHVVNRFQCSAYVDNACNCAAVAGVARLSLQSSTHARLGLINLWRDF